MATYEIIEREAHPFMVHADRDNRVYAALFALVVDSSLVVALVHRTGFRLVAASVERVEQRAISDKKRRPQRTVGMDCGDHAPSERTAP